MSKYQVLAEPGWCKYSKHIKDVFDGYERVEPVFNRPGLYYDRLTKNCWIETGEIAIKYDYEQFMYEMKMLNHIPLLKVEREAIKLLIMYGRKTRGEMSLMSIDNDYQHFRLASLSAMRLKKRFKAFKASLNTNKVETTKNK